jgi:tRNA 2-thiouridine synthesizing protein E
MTSGEALDDRFDDNGFLIEWREWTAVLAHEFAVAENIVLTEHHWEIITLLRDFYADYGDSPANRALVNYVKTHLGVEKGNSHYLMTLFPGSPARIGSRIAGLPKPKHCL